MSTNYSEASLLQKWIDDTQDRLSRRNTTSLRATMLTPFQFATSPLACVSLGPTTLPDLLLTPESPNNAMALYHESWLKDHENLAIQKLCKFANHSELSTNLNALVTNLRKDLDSLNQLKRVEWERQRTLSTEQNSINPGPYMISPFSAMEPWSIAVYFIVLCLHLMSGVSQDHCAFYLAILSSSPLGSPCNMVRSTSPLVPTTVETLVNRSNLKPKTNTYSCCPKCFCLYDVGKTPVTSCTAVEITGGDPCNEPLRKNSKPRRQFVMQDFKDWLARLYARPGLEELLDRDVFGSPANSQKMADIWDGTALREFRGPDGKLFMEGRGDEGRLIFSMNMDGFNPYGNKQSGKLASVGAIYMTCLNLPQEIRNRMENVFLVGIIPGPQEPSLTQINHLLAPLIDVLLELWHNGLFLQQTPRYALGRRILTAVVPLICDIPAAKKMAALGGARSNLFCSHCYLTQDNIDNLDYYPFWTRRTQEEHRQKANEWKEADTQKERDRIFDEYGLRWSELLRLPYWDPTSYVVIDPMHCFYLGLFHRHALHIWGMDAGMDDGDGVTYNKLSERPSGLEFRTAITAFYDDDFKKLRALSWNTLIHLCAFLKLRFAGNKPTLLSNLRVYRDTLSPHDVDLLHQTTREDLQGRNDVTNHQPALSGPIDVHQPAIPPGPPTDQILASSARTESELANLWNTAAKSTWMRLTINDLRRVLTMKDATIAETLEGKRKAWLIAEIQKRRLTAGIINDEFEVVGSEKKRLARKAGGPGAKTMVQPDGSLIWANSMTDGLDREFATIAQLTRIDTSVPEKSQSKKKEIPKTERVPKTCVLGKDTIPELRKDMLRSLFPSWAPKGPAYPGQAKGGKLHADQWRSLFTINLPITLVRLWGSEETTSRKGKMLQNFIFLVSAVKIASMRVITEEDIKLYEVQMKQYLTTLLEMFPGVRLVPNQHNAMHIGEFLRRFGPTHSWRCFAFERYNYLLQQTSTNQILGQMEKTMLEKFCMLQNLRAHFNTQHLPKELHHMIDAYAHLLRRDMRGTLPSEDLDSTDPAMEPADCLERDTLSRRTYELLKAYIGADRRRTTISAIDPHVIFRQSAVFKGVLFKVVDSSIADSQVAFWTRGTDVGHWGVGSISKIFQHERQTHEDGLVSDTYMLVEPFPPANLSDEGKTPQIFRQSEHFSFVIGRLFLRQRLPPIVLSFEEVIGHYACASIDDYRDGETTPRLVVGSSELRIIVA